MPSSDMKMHFVIINKEYIYMLYHSLLWYISFSFSSESQIHRHKQMYQLQYPIYNLYFASYLFFFPSFPSRFL